MMRIVITIVSLLMIENSYAINCRSEIKQVKDKIELADSLTEKSQSFFQSHDTHIRKGRFSQAKKQLSMAIIRLNAAIEKYNLTQSILEKKINYCPEKKDQIEDLLLEIDDKLFELTFIQQIYKEIEIRL